MLCVLSPAKSLDFEPASRDMPRAEPQFQGDAAVLARSAGRLSRARLKALMGLSDSLTELNYQRFKSFAEAPDAAATKQAALAFSGDTYIGLDFASLGPEAKRRAGAQLRILSGLYGLLGPWDAIQPYRLEMGRKLKTGRAGSLYEYWGTRLAEALDEAAEAAGAGYILNCASQEYFRAAREDALRTAVITPTFLDEKGGEAKVIGFFAKRARGAMARFVLESGAAGPGDLARFDWEGYRFQPEASTAEAPVFLRREAVAA